MTSLTSTPSALSALHVLLVDDDSFMLELLVTMLRKIGVSRIVQASDGQRALAAFEPGRARPDLIICDIHMPGKDGFQVMEEIGARGYRGGVVLLSGMTSRVLNSAALMGRFHHLNVLGVLQKPVSREALADLLARALASQEHQP
ncbi:response regulator [Janthinobacterium fluminis]|uniref:Response regulator n=1 Tax=Janthinobacterium fluminis TaxID=2987524 RepID=A0ABT5JUN1_9BURK|nr:response regulator [Janthinobacterium fluminis]MDC8756451.1 response regulator [Janthinobacterium fluminis]